MGTERRPDLIATELGRIPETESLPNVTGFARSAIGSA